MMTSQATREAFRKESERLIAKADAFLESRARARRRHE